MITLDNINALYNKYTTLATADADLCTERNLHQLMMFAMDSEHVDFDGDCIVLNRAESPLKLLEIERICGAEDLGSHMAVVMPAAVLFISKRTGDVKVFLAE